MRSGILLALVAGCGNVTHYGFDAPPPPVDAAPDPADAAPDSVPARCDPTKDFGAPTLVAGINTTDDEAILSLTADERTAVIMTTFPNFDNTVAISTRGSTADAFGAPSQALTAAVHGGPGIEQTVSISPDALAMYVVRLVIANGMGTFDLDAATRTSTGDPFSVGGHVVVDGANLAANVVSATISLDGMTLYWVDTDAFHAATRVAAAEFTGARVVAPVGLLGSAPVLSNDELQLFYVPPLGQGAQDIFVATRASKNDMFHAGVPVPNVNDSMASDIPTFVTRDGCILYLASNRAGGMGGFDFWEAHRPM